MYIINQDKFNYFCKGVIKIKKIFFLFLVFLLTLVLLACSSSSVSDSVFQDGSREHPFLLNGAGDIAAIGRRPGWGLNKHYKLAYSIHINTYENWVPIGTPKRPFTGELDGNSHWITGLQLDSPDSPYTGLFGYIGEDGVVINLKLRTGDLKGGANTGILAGVNKGIIGNCEIHGDVLSNYDDIGGVVGVNEGLILAVTYFGQVVGKGFVGGLVGENTGDIVDCETRGDVIGIDDYIGGIAGINSGIIEDVFNEGQVTGNDLVGGIAGENNGRLSNVYYNGEVKGIRCGGVTAFNTSFIEKCETNGQVQGSYKDNGDNTGPGGIGGIVGVNFEGEIHQSFTRNTVYGHDNVGGLVGYCENDIISDCFVHKTVDIRGKNIGHFIGYTSGTKISRCYTHGSINLAETAENVGQFLGYTDEGTSLEDCYLIDNSDQFYPYGEGYPEGFVIKISETEAEIQKTFSTFDFKNIWIYIEDERFPQLKYRFENRSLMY